MIPYKNLSGKSGVELYDTDADVIKIKFKKMYYIYSYDYATNGAEVVEEMKRMAEAGRGLSTFIAQKIKKNFATKVPL
tara:strand:+ start:519 stop:752 length:234 start_codon:yes stop_codon:yes gene_type:complete